MKKLILLKQLTMGLLHIKIRVKFNGGCLKQDRPKVFHGRIVNVYIVYEITDSFNVSSYPKL